MSDVSPNQNKPAESSQDHLRETGAGRSLIALAPAKLNVSLRILRRRDDGFHDLESVFAGVSLYDTLFAKRRDDGCVTLRLFGGTNDVTSGSDNLVVRAAEEIRAQSGTSFGADFLLVKRIPSQAGLGGGSSDAAAAITIVNRLWQLNWQQEKLHAVAASLGSDLNFFLAGAVTALAQGRGERVVPLENSPPFHAVIVHPSFGASTKGVFEHLRVQPKEGLSVEQHRASVAPVFAGRAAGVNDLLPALEASEPRFQEWLNQLRRATPGEVHWTLTGSGTAVYTFVASRSAGRLLAARVRSIFPNAQAFAVGAGTLRFAATDDTV